MKSLDLEQEVSSFSKSYYDSFSGTAKIVNDSISTGTFSTISLWNSTRHNEKWQ